MVDNSSLGGGFLSGSSGGFLDLEPSINRNQSTQIGLFSNNYHRHTNSKLNMVTGVENDSRIGLMEPKGLTPMGYSIGFGKGKAAVNGNAVNNTFGNESEEDEPSLTEDGSGENLNGGKGKKGSPWQRMKWTDNVISLLIQVVACVGDDVSLEGMEGSKRKSGALQKKGKWKTISKIMISRGCHVSPQQCEDKFNDLNKRYKKLNDILGRGTSCRVVENPSLMDSMPHLSAKMKEDVKKILSSKHLFYKEMCAYHNGQMIPNCNDLDLQIHSLPLPTRLKDYNGSEDDDTGENDESEDDESGQEDGNNAGGDMGRVKDRDEKKHEIEDDGHFWPQSGGLDSFLAEMANVFQDPMKSHWERQDWIKKRKWQLLEQRIAIQAEAFELEKRRFKWERFCSKKNREMCISRLENERLILENERMMLQLKQKELDLDVTMSEGPFNPTALGIDGPLGRDQFDFGRHQ